MRRRDGTINHLALQFLIASKLYFPMDFHSSQSGERLDVHNEINTSQYNVTHTPPLADTEYP